MTRAALTRLRNNDAVFLTAEPVPYEERQDDGNYDGCDADASALGKDVDGERPAASSFCRSQPNAGARECTHDEDKKVYRTRGATFNRVRIDFLDDRVRKSSRLPSRNRAASQADMAAGVLAGARECRP